MGWTMSIPAPRPTRRVTGRESSAICIGVPRHSALFSSPWSRKSVLPFLRNRSLASAPRSQRKRGLSLGVQRLHVDRGRGPSRGSPRRTRQKPRPLAGFPGRHLIGVNVEMLGQLGQRSIALDGGKRHLRLESRAVVPARSFVHCLSCSRRSSPLSGRNSTYRLVQISGASFPDPPPPPGLP